MTNDLALQVARSIPVRNAWYLLLYAWDLASWQGRSRHAAESAPHLLGLLARILADAAETLVKYQLGRAHSSRGDQIRGVRGRIGFSESLRRMSFERAAAYCTFPELTVDTVKNRIIRGTLNQLARSAHLKPGGTDEITELRERLRRVERIMEGVTLKRISIRDFAQLQLGRGDYSYALPISVCQLIHSVEIPEEVAGDQVLTSLLRNEVTFHDLFERFVRNFYRMHLLRSTVRSEQLSWFDELASVYVPQMRTDMSIVDVDPPKRLVVDTKYSLTTLATGRFGGEKFKSENLYQIYAYLRTQEHLSAVHRTAEGMLLYPTTTADLESTMIVQGHKIRVATVDLTKPWLEIEARLLSLVKRNGAQESVVTHK